jgi:hypothetical protein
MKLENLIVIHFNADDLVALARGEARSVTTADGLTVQFDAEGTTLKTLKTARLPALNGRGVAMPPTATATKRLGALHGDCPYCESRNLFLAPHVRNRHPGKPIPYTGPDAVACPQCKGLFPSAHSLRIHRAMTHDRKRKGVKPT